MGVAGVFKSGSLADTGIWAFFVLLPAAAAGGAQALPLFLSLTGLALLPAAIPMPNKKMITVFNVLLLAFLAWVAVSSAWSPNDEHWRALRLPALMAFGMVVVGAGGDVVLGPRFWALSAAAFVVLAGLLAIEAWAGLPMNRAVAPDADFGEWVANPTRGAVVLQGLAWTTAAGFLAYGRLAPAVLALLAATALSAQFAMLASAAAFAVGLVAFGIGLFAPRLAILAATSALALWMLTAPLLTPLVLSQPSFVEMLPTSWAHRAAIWTHVVGLIEEQPWFGYGLDAGQAHIAAFDARVMIDGMSMDALPVHPHSASLQVWFELGAVGALLATALIAYGGWRLANALQHNRHAAAAAAAALCGFGLIANVSYSVWQEWWLATILVAASGVNAVLRLTKTPGHEFARRQMP